MSFLRVEIPDSEQTIELPLEDDGTLLLTTLKSKFPNANGLTYDCGFRTEKFANVQIVKLSVTLREGKFLPLPEGWFEFTPLPNTPTYKIFCTKGTAEPDLFQFPYDGGLQSYYGKKGLLNGQDHLTKRRPRSSYHPLQRMTREPGEMKLGPTKAWSKGAGLTPMAVQTGGGRYSALLNDEGSFVSRPSATNIRLGPPRPFGYRVVPTKLQKTVQATRIFTQSVWRKKASRKSSLSQQGAADPTTEQVPFKAKSDIKGKPDRAEDEIQRKTHGIMNEFLSSGDLQAVEDQIYTPKYAEVCKLIFETEIPSASGTGIIRFREFLLDRFQQTFEKQKKFEEEIISNQKAQLEADTEEKTKKIEMELDKRKGISKHIMLGNISFFGELFKLKIVTVEIVNFYISELLKSPTEEQLECLSKFISIIGKAYEEEYDMKYQRAVAEARSSEKQIHIQLNKLDVYLDEMKKLSRREDLSSRIRFILMRVLDLKKNQWIPHREEDIFTEVGSANPKKLEVELATLKSNNARLTAALQESTANVGEWKRQLEAFKEENVALKSKLLDTETNKGDELNSGELKKEITTLRLKCDSLETKLKTKDEKVKDLSTELKDSLSVIENFKCLCEESQRNEKITRLVLSQIDAALNSIRSQIHFS
ncbi:uncharacterized protein LOC136030495 isoform X2 [Artemia franciscana]|uniref:MIF4G domain-containing protein n=1 Tax=Artemia franciscana TaxID=6661 RepID=A0AA88KX87_ARTSF|nr:hypothetical protein QYM36_015747 [Artemia franciscana]